jgi:hypothetical protein
MALGKIEHERLELVQGLPMIGSAQSTDNRDAASA